MTGIRIYIKQAPAIALLLVSISVCKAETILDVLILYTSEVESYYSGYDGVVAQVIGSFEGANRAFENSQVDIRLRFRAIEKLDFQQSDEDMNDDLEFISESGDVAALRNEVGADLVCLFRSGSVSGTEGVAWLLNDANGDPDSGFSVVRVQGAMIDHIFQHEIGHNLGAAHDRENSENGGLYPYSHGYRFEASDNAEYRTVMAYAPGYRINYFSNPSVSYRDTPIGVASGENAADNAGGFGLIAARIDSYRSHIHRLPIAVAGEDVVDEDFNGDGLEYATLNGVKSNAEEAIHSWEWTWVGGQASGETMSADFPLGETVVTLEVTDSKGYTAQDTVLVTVVGVQLAIRSIEAGGDNSFYIQGEGTVLGMGSKGNGRLGYFWQGGGTEISQSDPETVFFPEVAFVSSGSDYSLFLKTDGSAWGTGLNWNGRLGTGDSHQVFEPTKILSLGVVEISAGESHNLFLMADGSVWGAGSNRRGELGLGDVRESKTLTEIVDSEVVSVEAGAGRSFFIKENGSLWYTGEGADYSFIDAPIELMPSGVASVSSGWDQSLIVKTDGSLWVMGRNQYGQLGTGRGTHESVSPKKIVDSGVIKASAGTGYSLFVKEDGSLWQMGLKFVESDTTGNEPQFAVPEMIVPTNVADVSAGTDHALFQTNDGSVWAVGNNEFGQLGNGNTEYQSEPIVVLATDLVKNGAPLADAGPDIISLDHDNSGSSTVSLNGTRSSDDWLIRSYIWNWEGGMELGARINVQFELGETEVTLTVRDNEGVENTDTILVTVDDPSKYNQTRVVQEEGNSWLEVKPYTQNLDYALMYSDDMVRWYTVHVFRKQQDSSLLFELLQGSPRFYRVRIETPD